MHQPKTSYKDNIQKQTGTLLANGCNFVHDHVQHCILTINHFRAEKMSIARSVILRSKKNR